ncbi:MAG: M23 family metallopeptidase, partial [Candidatus Roizmanbacteria bacterium]|nr:M23 family metallopeptidase [Candidatus Roizmanbacteria bacterium]
NVFKNEILTNLSTISVISDKAITGVQFVDFPEGDLVGLPALTTTSKGWSFPITTRGGDLELWLTVGVFNHGNTPANITVEAFDASGNTLGVIGIVTLPQRATHFITTTNMDGIIPAETATLKVFSDQPVSGYEVIGVVNGYGLTATMGIPEEDQTTAGFEIIGSNDGGVLNAYPMVRMGDGSVKSTAGSLESRDWIEGINVTSIRVGTQASEGEVTKKVRIAQTSSSTISPIFPVDNTLTGSDGKGWYHYPGSEYHFPSKGYADADDTYALDLNLSGDYDNGKDVFAIEGGIVKQVDTCIGWVLLEHSGKGTFTWKGRSYSTWYSGYVHMKNIPNVVQIGASISKGTKIGTISGMGKKDDGTCGIKYDNHLHFAIYVGKIVSTNPSNAFLESVDPGPIAGYSGLTYGEMESGGGVFNHNIDDKFTDAIHIFEKGGTPTDWHETSSYGLYDHMYYTFNASSTADNWGRWKLDIAIPSTTTTSCNATGSVTYDECYRIYALIPPNYATTKYATYKIYKNSTLLTSKVINQSVYCYQGSDCWAELGRFNLNQGDKIEVYLDDKTGEANQSKYVG